MNDTASRPTRTVGLRGEIHALSHDGQVVITVQLWAPGTLVTFRNGTRVARERKTPAAAAARFGQARKALEPTALDDAAARARIAELTGFAVTDTCPSSTCGELLPVGGYRCTRCAMFPARSAAGSLNGARVVPGVIRLDQPEQPR